MKNYKLINKKEEKRLGVTAFLYEHIKTKAKITYVKTDDKNKTFAIAFKTPPSDSMGKAHILEHSVLNGSKKYKTKEPFMDMATSSLQTYLNAMTFPDKTVYPVSSENDKDFFNLTDVYLDAVFNPRVLEKEEIFMQEGIRYEISDDGKIELSGVVFNEMKGALSDPDTIIYSDITEKLYKNSCYEYNSGGDPFEIAKLKYKDFIDFYKSFYHPSNSSIYFYGDMDIDFYLDYLDKNYLSNYDYKEIHSEINVVENSYPDIIKSSYPSNEIQEDSDYLSYSILTNDGRSFKDSLTQSIVTTALFNSDSSEITNKIYEEISPEAFFARAGYGNRSSITIFAQKTSEDKMDRFVEIIEEGIEKASKGISKDSLKAAFSYLNFTFRDQVNSAPRGLEYFLMSSFDGDALDVFNLLDCLDDLEKKIDSNYYENFVKEYLLNNKTRLLMISSQNLDYTEEKIKVQEKELNDYKNSLTKNDLEKLKEKSKDFKKFQERKDTAEEKATIPKLELSDVDLNLEKIPRLVENDDFEFVFHNYETADMIYVSSYFNIDHLNLEELKFAQILGDFLAAVDTDKHTYGELDNLVWIYMGSLSTSVDFLRLDNGIENDFKISFKTTKENLRDSLSLIKEVMTKSKLNSKKRALELLKQRKTVIEMSLYDSGHVVAMNRASSHFDKFNYLKEELNGLAYLKFIKEMINLVNDDFDTFKKELEKVYSKIFTKDMSLNVTASEKDFDFIKKSIKETFSDLKENENARYPIEFERKFYKEAILTDATVNYISMAADLKDFGLDFSGKLLLASSIISNPYLYTLIRAKGGAYGAGLTFDKSAIFATYSYRDPNLRKTIDTFKGVPEITKNIDIDKRDFTNQQISTLGALLSPKSPFQKGNLDYLNYKRNINQNDRIKLLKDVKNAKLNDIKNLDKFFEKAIKKDNLVVFGNRKDILENKDYFDKIIDLNI